MSDHMTPKITRVAIATGEPDDVARLRLAMRQTAKALRNIAKDLDAAILTDPPALLVEAAVGFGRIEAARDILTEFSRAAADAAAQAGIPTPQPFPNEEIN